MKNMRKNKLSEKIDEKLNSRIHLETILFPKSSDFSLI